MKKRIIFLILILILIFKININVEAKTLATLKSELAKQKEDLKNKNDEQQLTENQMSSINNNIKNIQSTITANYKKMEELNNEIETLNNEIKLKEEEIKKIINFAQVSNGESAYLEYMFGAEDFTDFIYRTAVAEQLSAYNDKLIDEHNKKITENKNKTKELHNQEIELANKQKSLEQEYSKLGSSLADITETKVDIEDAIKQQEELIKNYQKMGCLENEEIKNCLSRLNSLPPDTKFWRPLNSGRMSSKFGSRILLGKKDFHEGLDIATPIGTPVYSIANGIVVHIGEAGTTGNAVYINHTVNGKRYTSIYMHLSRYNVRVGDVVSKDSIIAYSGCTGGCYGAHLHLGLLTGNVGVDHTLWDSKFYSNFIDPMSKVNFPNIGSFNNRTTYYR